MLPYVHGAATEARTIILFRAWNAYRRGRTLKKVETLKTLPALI